MASYAFLDKDKNRYVLGPPIISAQETFSADSTINPAYELVYWNWALSVAQKWKQRLGMPVDSVWNRVQGNLSKLVIKDKMYLPAETTPDAYTNPRYLKDHPIIMGIYGFFPKTELIDTSVLKNTVQFVLKNWSWEQTWGWDCPMAAMCLARLGMPDEAVNMLLMNNPKNRFFKNGHNYQRANLPLYLPGNGSLLAAVALMAAGWDGCKIQNPGFPKNGKWNVKWENINPFP
jgi:protein-glucosylgalactosylhydroxylysine glucosidase